MRDPYWARSQSSTPSSGICACGRRKPCHEATHLELDGDTVFLLKSDVDAPGRHLERECKDRMTLKGPFLLLLLLLSLGA